MDGSDDDVRGISLEVTLEGCGPENDQKLAVRITQEPRHEDRPGVLNVKVLKRIDFEWSWSKFVGHGNYLGDRSDYPHEKYGWK